jgi:hypothetical protein
MAAGPNPWYEKGMAEELKIKKGYYASLFF